MKCASVLRLVSKQLSYVLIDDLLVRGIGWLLLALLLLFLFVMADVTYYTMYRVYTQVWKQKWGLTIFNCSHERFTWIQLYNRSISITHEQGAEVVVLYIEEWNIHRKQLVRLRAHKLPENVSKRLHPLQFWLQLHLFLFYDKNVKAIDWCYHCLDLDPPEPSDQLKRQSIASTSEATPY